MGVGRNLRWLHAGAGVGVGRNMGVEVFWCVCM